MVKFLERELSQKYLEESFYHEIYDLTIQLKKIAKLINSHMLDRKILFELNNEETHEQYLVHDDEDDEDEKIKKKISKMKKNIKNQEMMILDKLGAINKNKEQIIEKIKDLKNSQYKLFAYNSKNNKNQKKIKEILFYPLISIIHYKFSIRDKLIVEYLIKKKRVPLRIIGKIFYKNFKGKKIDLQITNETRKLVFTNENSFYDSLKTANQETFNIYNNGYIKKNGDFIHFSFLHYGKILALHDCQDEKINNLLYEAIFTKII